MPWGLQGANVTIVRRHENVTPNIILVFTNTKVAVGRVRLRADPGSTLDPDPRFGSVEGRVSWFRRRVRSGVSQNHEITDPL